ncbi:hypothetical protein NM688_g9286 [Phlebia brevispora]|uniref:Uncharacterized protein n=1 Tax=Phlebia brevispora TaxID=194682 RepID=A0ACC1RKU9_9APHY|nr:hypothetical protein NM688_g9286 [Phlebia brevispora]
MDTFTAHKVYREQLGKRSQGVPLWFPEPEKKQVVARGAVGRPGGEIQIGDVGYFDEGRFVRILNVTAERVKGDDIEGPPNGEPPLTYNKCLEGIFPDTLQPGLHGYGISNIIKVALQASAYVQLPLYQTSGKRLTEGLSSPRYGGVVPAGARAGFEFMANSTEGAMLLLPGHAHLVKIATNSVFRQYIRQHHDSWVQHAKNLGFEPKPEDIVLVSGTMKTSNWTVASFKQIHRSAGANLSGSLQPAGSVGFSLQLSHQTPYLSDYRSGPSLLPGETLSEDQCVFVRIYMIRYRPLFLPPKIIEAGAGPHELPRHDDDDGPSGGDARIVSEPESNFHYAPLSTVIDYILEGQHYPDADAAIACEDDITEMLGSEQWPDDLKRHLEENPPDVYVDPETKLGALSLVTAIQRTREASVRRNMPVEGDDEHVSESTASLSRGLNPLSYGDLFLPRAPPNVRTVKWPHVALIDNSAEGNPVSSIALSPDGVHVATGMEDGN